MEQAERKVSIRSHWLHERSMLFEKYAVNMPSNADRIDLQLEYPACGWIDMHVIVNDKEKVVIDTSYVYEPFEDIKEWLENIVSHIFDFTPAGVNIYNECFNFLLYFVPIFIQTDEQMTHNSQELYGLFYIYDGDKRKIVADALCETKEFVKTVYQNILAFAQTQRGNERFFEEWIETVYGEECDRLGDDDTQTKEIFVNKVSSELIERFLADKNSTRRFIQIK